MKRADIHTKLSYLIDKLQDIKDEMSEIAEIYEDEYNDMDEEDQLGDDGDFVQNKSDILYESADKITDILSELETIV